MDDIAKLLAVIKEAIALSDRLGHDLVSIRLCEAIDLLSSELAAGDPLH